MRRQSAHVLAGATGGYSERRASAALDQHLLCVWSNTLTLGSAKSLAVVPDGCIDLTWVNEELIVAGPDVGAVISPLTTADTVVGARFRPGAASKWLGLPMKEIVGTRLLLSEFWGRRADDIAQRMSEDNSPSERANILERILTEHAPDIDPPAADIGFVFNTLKFDSGGRGLSLIIDRLDVSPRTLRRRCDEAFGYGPKTLERILRFQRFLKLARSMKGEDLAGLAFQVGYADQAHMTREVRSLSGFSPAQVVLQLGV